MRLSDLYRQVQAYADTHGRGPRFVVLHPADKSIVDAEFGAMTGGGGAKPATSAQTKEADEDGGTEVLTGDWVKRGTVVMSDDRPVA